MKYNKNIIMKKLKVYEGKLDKAHNILRNCSGFSDLSDDDIKKAVHSVLMGNAFGSSKEQMCDSLNRNNKYQFTEDQVNKIIDTLTDISES